MVLRLPKSSWPGFALEPAAIRIHDWSAALGLSVKTVPVEPGPFHPFEADPDHGRQNAFGRRLDHCRGGGVMAVEITLPQHRAVLQDEQRV